MKVQVNIEVEITKGKALYAIKSLLFNCEKITTDNIKARIAKCVSDYGVGFEVHGFETIINTPNDEALKFMYLLDPKVNSILRTIESMVAIEDTNELYTDELKAQLYNIINNIEN